jgi:spermidine/putrescine transport system substrate-binding protein
VFTRRDFLRISAAGAVTVAVGGALSRSVLAQPAPAPSPLVGCTPGGPLNLFTWQGYEGTGVPSMDAFYADNGIQLNMTPIGNESMLQVMKSPGAETWDAFSVNQGDNGYFYSQGIMSPISVAEVPNLTKMYPQVLDNPIWKVGDGLYNAVPWTFGPIGINYLKTKYPDGINQYAAALDPQYRVGCFDDKLNMVSTGACAVGLDPGALTRDELNGPVKDWLMKARPQLKVISTSIGDQLTVLLSEDVDFELVGLLWFVPQGAAQDAEVGFSIPEEGSYGFCDSLAITPWAPNRCNALALANAYMDPVTVAPLQGGLFQIGPTPEINDALPSDVRSLYPDDIPSGFFDKLKWNISHTDPNGPYATIEEWGEVWDEVKLAG